MIAKPVSTVAPIGGWNTRDAISSMPSGDAYVLDNFIPDIGDLKLRKGYTEHANSMGSGNVDTVVEFHAGSTQKLICCANNKIYDATAGGDASGNAIGSPTITSNQWSTVMFKGRLFFVNGADAPLDYDGTTLSATSWTGPTLTTLSVVTVYKGRLYFIEDNSTSFWYGGAGSVSGTLTEFALADTSIGITGNLVGMGTWTRDGGSGPDDYIAFITSTGDVIVYTGDDPGATDFTLVGHYSIGEPITDRGIVQVGGDLLIITTSDYVRMSEVMTTGQLGAASKLSGAVRERASTDFGWQATVYQPEDLIIFNVPRSAGNTEQHVVNIKTMAACRFTGLNARCWGVYNGELYFGGTDGSVYKYTGNNDDGTDITGTAKTAWGDLGSPYRKRVSASRPIITTDGSIDYSFSVAFDFKEKNVKPVTTSNSSGSEWGTAEWDVASWGGDSIESRWRISGGWGQYVSANVQVASQASVSWQRVDYRFETGKHL